MLCEIFARPLDESINTHSAFKRAGQVNPEIQKGLKLSTCAVPFLLARVCREWRRIALESPELWSKPVVMLDDLRNNDYDPWRTF